MKKFRLFFFACIFTALAWMPAQALQFEKLSDTPEAAEIYAQADKAVSRANDSLERQNLESEPVTVNDIDWDKAFKIYVDTSIFQMDTVSTQEILNTLVVQDSYIWRLPIQKDGKTVELDFTKGMPVKQSSFDVLTEEEIAQLRAKVGKWHITAVGITDDTTLPTLRIRLEDAASANHLNGENQLGILIGGESDIHYTMIGLIANETEITHFIPMDMDIVISTASRRPLCFAEGMAHSLPEWQPILSKMLPQPPQGIPPVVIGVLIIFLMLIVICLSVFSLYRVQKRRKEGAL